MSKLDVFGNEAEEKEKGISIWTAVKEGLQGRMDDLFSGMGHVINLGIAAPAALVSSFVGGSDGPLQGSAVSDVASGLAASSTPEYAVTQPVKTIVLPGVAYKLVSELRDNPSLSFDVSFSSASILGTEARHGVNVRPLVDQASVGMAA